MERLQSYQDNEQLRLQELLCLDATGEKLAGIDAALGSDGVGTFVLRQVLDSDQIELMQAEVFDPHGVAWRDNHDRFINLRGLEVVENHTVFALKLHRGDKSKVEKVPHMRALAKNIEDLISGLDSDFPSLKGWRADEMSLHRYDNQEVGLSFHKDNLRFTGLIAVLTLEGESDVVIKDDDGNEHVFAVGPGDLNLTRATGLYESRDENGKRINLCPEHAVMNLRTPYRTSFIARANNKPAETITGFEYDNWPVQETR